jgi:hypothetical protein
MKYANIFLIMLTITHVVLIVSIPQLNEPYVKGPGKYYRVGCVYDCLH